jgi:hypothetical protein
VWKCHSILTDFQNRLTLEFALRLLEFAPGALTTKQSQGAPTRYRSAATTITSACRSKDLRRRREFKAGEEAKKQRENAA